MAFRPSQHNRTISVGLAAILLVTVASFLGRNAAAASTTRSRREMMQQTNAQSSDAWLLQMLAGMRSPLSKAESDRFAELYKKTGSVGDLCEAGKLYCDAKSFNLYYQNLLQFDGKKQKDISVFFRETELVVGREISIEDPRLQSAALEKNRLQLAEFDTPSGSVGMSKYNYLNVAKMPERSFLPAELAQTLPFSSDSAVKVFQLDPSSILAQESAKTFQICQEGIHKDGTTELNGEAAACATSLEALQSLVRSPMLLGPHDAANVKALSTDERLHSGSSFRGKVVEVSLEASVEQRHAVCHNLMYPSAVYFCHYLPRTRVYSVMLQPLDAAGAQQRHLVRAIAMCHMDTTGWNPRHLAFQNLLTLPGHGEACHWVLQGSMTFVPTA
ncbi:hypothetical protein KP509_10G058900 [Ceratopteris richardii]|uniref:BURP domain-containing protein n=1 Tax=Ceratopteris richardii TaxID=49495 RepID=A0A8T2U1U9_CERRI|nr:hypothetical protein KP509_10G058900 [Ceratopteris richardii]